MNSFTIKDLENLSGIKAHTIRIWEQRYGFLKPRRTNTNIRYYSNDELKTLLNIALLNKYGFRISQIDKMNPSEVRNKLLSLNDATAVRERITNELLQLMVDLDMKNFESVLDKYINEKGIEATVIQIIFPFLEKIGILWQTGHIHPAQEHLVSNIIRRKILVAIDAASAAKEIDKTFLLFLPEGEHHELGLLFVYFLLRKHGAKTIYLGANVPVNDVAEVIHLKKPDGIFIHLTACGSGFRLERFLQQVKLKFGKTDTILSGQVTRNYSKKLPEGVSFKTSLGEVIDYISAL
jgi:MerR family transcriptional regulator, light-induced transcriptional regulator